MGLQVAIDGPASAGKSTVAKRVAKKFGYVYCDTGAMYRAVTLAALQQGLAMTDTEKISELAKQIKITFQPAEPEQRVFINGQEVTRDIRLPKVAKNVSAVAAIPTVRQEMTKQQRQIAAEGGIVMDGRDIGTVVLPDAELKIFLIASVEERAERRFKENQEKGIETDFETLKREIAERDYKDSHRKVSPLKAADDAITFDTTGVDIDGVVKFIQEKAEKIIDMD